MTITPTAEQDSARGLFASEESFVVEAGAGTGKTSTLDLLARDTMRHGQYVAFNRAIVDESRTKFPLNVDCSTAHSIARRAVGRPYAHRLDSRRMRPAQAAKILGITDTIRLDVNGVPRMLSPGWQASHVMAAIARFCQSADDAPTRAHFPHNPALDLDGRANNRTVAAHLEPWLRPAWADILDPNGKLRFGHDHYLKIWQLGQPRIFADFVLFDEAQDADPVMMAAILAQDAQVVWVGDSQQAIYEWRGAVNALDNARGDGLVATLSQSFRFGPAIADVANACLEVLDADLRLRGLPSIPSTTGRLHEPSAVLCRSNAAALEVVLQTLDAGKVPALVGGGRALVWFAESADELQNTGRTDHPELACFPSWTAVLEYVEHDPQGSELALAVGLVEKYGSDTIRAALQQETAEEAADVIVSTAHKAKGREWDTVRLAGDFHPAEDRPDRSEWRLLYVAATRARRTLDYSRCEPLVNLLGPT